MFDKELSEKLIGADRGITGNAQDVKRRWYPTMLPPAELKAQVEQIAEKQGCSVRTIIWRLMREALARHADRPIPDNIVAVDLLVDKSIRAELAEHARTNRQSIESLIRTAVGEWLDKNKPPFKAVA